MRFDATGMHDDDIGGGSGKLQRADQRDRAFGKVVIGDKRHISIAGHVAVPSADAFEPSSLRVALDRRRDIPCPGRHCRDSTSIDPI